MTMYVPWQVAVPLYIVVAFIMWYILRGEKEVASTLTVGHICNHLCPVHCPERTP